VTQKPQQRAPKEVNVDIIAGVQTPNPEYQKGSHLDWVGLEGKTIVYRPLDVDAWGGSP